MPYPADAPPIELSLSNLHFLLHAGRTTQRLSYATFTLLIWDTIITFGREVQYVWPARWTVIKILFLFNRYVAPVMLSLGIWTMTGYAEGLSDKFCRSWLLAGSAMEMGCLSLVTFVMVFRLHATLGLGNKGFMLMLMLWLAGIIASIVVYIEFVWNFRRFIYWDNQLGNFCFAVIPTLWPLLLSTVIQHGLLLILLIYKAVRTPRSADTAILRILLTDGIIFYLITLAAALFTVLTWRFASVAYNGLPLYAAWATCTMAASRLLLSLKIPIQYPISSSLEHLPRTKDPAAQECEPIELQETNFNQKQWVGDQILSHQFSREQQEQSAENLTMENTPKDNELSVIRTKITSKHGNVVHVDVEDLDWWDCGADNRGIKVLETRLGRYDSWL